MKDKSLALAGRLCLLVWLGAGNVGAWDYDGHYVINQLALASLPTNFPAFVLTPSARERIAFLGGEPDRWRSTSDLALQQANGPDHYIDLEELKDYELNPEALPLLRYDFVGKAAVFRAAHPERFPAPDPAKDRAHTRNLVGFLPWTIAEYSARLKSAFSLVEQNKLVGPLYQLEKQGKLSGKGETGLAGRGFLEEQLVKAGQMLGDLWATAWLGAPEDK
jgi:hypothetical protein